MYLKEFALLGVDLVGDIGDGRDDVHIEFAVESLLDDFHVEQTEKAATETKSQCCTALGREGEAGVIELQLFQ